MEQLKCSYPKNENLNQLNYYLSTKETGQLLEGLNAILDFLVDPELVKSRGGLQSDHAFGIDVLINTIRIIQK